MRAIACARASLAETGRVSAAATLGGVVEETVRRVSRVSREYNPRSHENTERGILALALRSASPQRSMRREDNERECGERPEQSCWGDHRSFHFWLRGGSPLGQCQPAQPTTLAFAGRMKENGSIRPYTKAQQVPRYSNRY